MSRLTIQSAETAQEGAAERLAAAQKANGFLPNLLGVLANAPTALETYQTVTQINNRNSLSSAEREVIQITAAVTNGCGFCVAGHTKLAKVALKLSEDRKSTRLNSSHVSISYAVFCLKKTNDILER